VRENKKENISVFFNLFLFCFISNSKSKFENSHCFLLIIFYKVIFAEFSKPNIFLIGHLVEAVTVDPFRRVFGSSSIFFGNLMFCFSLINYVSNIY